MDALRDLWKESGLEDIQTRETTVQRTFNDFTEFWSLTTTGPSIRPILASMNPADLETLKSRVLDALPADASGRITYTARANAIQGCTS